MPALIEEATVFDVKCPDAGCVHLIAEGVTSRSEAEFIANSHDETWHTPVLEDVPA